jgi:putative oxidoreductase
MAVLSSLCPDGPAGVRAFPGKFSEWSGAILASAREREEESVLSIAARWISWAPQFRSILRIVAALLFIPSGTMKLFAWPIGMPPNNATAELLTQMGIGGILEVFGGALILIGLFTRPVAFILSGEMAVAYFQFHAPQSFWPIINQGGPAILFCFIFLYLSSAGAGPWSVDALRGKG